MMMKTFLLGILALFLALPCRANMSPERAEEIVGAGSRQVLAALQKRDWAGLAQWVDPVRGVQTSPYIYVTDYGPQWTRGDVRRPDLKQVSMWGRYDGRGDAIYLRWKAYFDQFVYDRPFQNVRPRFNSFVSRGNTTNNLRQRYSNAIFVEYYWADSGNVYHNWSSLWLIWQPIGKQWYLSGLAHDEWTI